MLPEDLAGGIATTCLLLENLGLLNTILFQTEFGLQN